MNNHEKAILFWIIGSFFIMLGAFLAGHINPDDVGASAVSVAIAFITAFGLIAIGAMFIISAADHLAEEKVHG
jgi:hypothetical protein